MPAAWSPGSAPAGTERVMGRSTLAWAGTVTYSTGRVIQDPSAFGGLVPSRRSKAPSALLKASVAYTRKVSCTLP